MPANMPGPQPDGYQASCRAGEVTSGRISLPSGATPRLALTPRRMLTLTSQASNHHP